MNNDAALIEAMAAAIGKTKVGDGEGQSSIRDLLATISMMAGKPFDFDGFERDMRSLAEATLCVYRQHMGDGK